MVDLRSVPDADAAVEAALDVWPDLAAALDQAAERVRQGDIDAAGRYARHVRSVISLILEATGASAEVVIPLLEDEAARLPLTRRPTDEPILGSLVRSSWVLTTRAAEVSASASEALAVARREIHHPNPVEEIMELLDLASSDIAALMGVSRQAVEQWRAAGVPPHRRAKLTVIVNIARLLDRWLRPGHAAAAVRRPAPRFDGATYLDAITDDRHEEVLAGLEEAFDFTRVA